MPVSDITRSILNAQFKGQTGIKFVNQTDTITDTTFDNSGILFTEKDSFSLVQAEPTRTDIKIDQGDETIDTAVESGEFTVSGSIPSFDLAAFKFFFPEAAVQPTITDGITGIDDTTKFKSITAFNFEPKELDVTMWVESANKKYAYILTHVRLTAVMNHESVATKLFTLNFKGTVLKPRTDGVGGIMHATSI